MIHLYGIKNCDTVKKARKWLDTEQINYQFHDLKTELLLKDLNLWLIKIGWETLINKRSTTWRQLSDDTKKNMDEKLARQTILAQVTLIKRPILVYNNNYQVGFKDTQYQQIFK